MLPKREQEHGRRTDWRGSAIYRRQRRRRESAAHRGLLCSLKTSVSKRTSSPSGPVFPGLICRAFTGRKRSKSGEGMAIGTSCSQRTKDALVIDSTQRKKIGPAAGTRGRQGRAEPRDSLFLHACLLLSSGAPWRRSSARRRQGTADFFAAAQACSNTQRMVLIDMGDATNKWDGENALL